MKIYTYLSKTFSAVTLITVLSGLLISTDTMSAVPIVQPGAPGEATREIDAETAVNIANSSYTVADVDFMRDMIIHHHQALVMSRLAAKSTNNKTILDLAGRIDVSQEDEISFMRGWLQKREEQVPDPTSEHSEHTHHTMIGMATPEQMTQLAESKSTDFDRLFLTLMINHHDGAIKMVEELRDQPGSTYDPILNEFVSDITNDQAVEIERMNALLIGLSSDPRAGLASGLYDAEEAIMNMQLVESQRKPLGFYDPANPAERGAEMRSRFWLGHVAKREENNTIFSLKGFIGNTFLTRLLVLNEQSAKDLKLHAEEEMKYLAELLPPLYGSKNID